MFLRIAVLGLLWLGLAGWDFSRHAIPLDEIRSGGPPKDGIPALSNPKFVTPGSGASKYLQDSQRVIGLVVRGQAKAYPIGILNWHEIVNDRIGGKEVAVTYCPLCGTGMVFDADSGGRTLTFGVSGLLYQSDMLLYDRQTESLWSQIKSEAVTGPLTGTRLRLLASTHTTWGDWKRRRPDTLVMSRNTGYRRDYGRNPYGDYDKNRTLFFPVNASSRRYHPKEQVVGVNIGDETKAYPFSELARTGGKVQDTVGGRVIHVVFDAKHRTVRVQDGEGNLVPSVTGFWFAWYTFHPDTKVYQAP